MPSRYHYPLRYYRPVGIRGLHESSIVASPLLDYSPLLYYRADEGITYESGMTINNWANQGSVGASGDLAIATAGQYPEHVLSDSNFNNQAVIAFDGGDRLENLTVSGVPGNLLAFWCVYSFQAYADLDTAAEVYGTNSLTTMGRFFSNGATGDMAFRSAGGLMNALATRAVDVVIAATGYALDSSGVSYYIDNVVQETGPNWQDNGVNDVQVCVGARPGGGEPSQCTIAEFGVFPSANFDSTARGVAQSYASSRYGV